MLEKGGIRGKENSFQSLMEFSYQIQKKKIFAQLEVTYKCIPISKHEFLVTEL